MRSVAMSNKLPVALLCKLTDDVTSLDRNLFFVISMCSRVTKEHDLLNSVSPEWKRRGFYTNWFE